MKKKTQKCTQKPSMGRLYFPAHIAMSKNIFQSIFLQGLTSHYTLFTKAKKNMEL